eukprot:TRINITY_DN9452_c0_g1_i3.p1 TRINITY_DN9452_c0_g1~~TRINITY_DN9452_c0_g1_i3.p1  ORF type:complete len:1068 (+),score=350.60 TRINITY_DN9452_c0_g1_i3:179-3382(+)
MASGIAEGLVERTGATVVAAQMAAVSSAVALGKVKTSEPSAVLEVCKKMGLCFVDMGFPPAAKDGVHWYRSRDALAKMPQSHPVMMPPSSPPLVVPGLCSNRRWLALLSLVGSPSMLHSADLSAGHTTVALHSNVIIDDFLPWKRGHPLHATASPPAHLWVPLAEKAVAKTHGSYNALSTATPDLARAVLDITNGGILAEHTFRGGDLSVFLMHAESSLVLLKPSGRLHQPHSVYTIARVAPTQSSILVYCPVVDQHMTHGTDGAKLVDARWVHLGELESFFGTWSTVSVNDSYLARKTPPVDLSSLSESSFDILGTGSVPTPSHIAVQPVLPPPPPPQRTDSSRKVETLEQEVQALTQLHLDALQSEVGTDSNRTLTNRIRLLKQTLVRLQDENTRKVDYTLEDGILTVLGTKWQRYTEGDIVDYSSQVQRQARELELSERQHKTEAKNLRRQLAELQVALESRSSQEATASATVIEAQKQHINQLYNDLNNLAAIPPHTPAPVLPVSDPVIGELEYTIKALSRELGEAHQAVQVTEGIKIELHSARDLIAKLTQCSEMQETKLQRLELQLLNEKSKASDYVKLEVKATKYEKDLGNSQESMDALKETVATLQSEKGRLEALPKENEVLTRELQASRSEVESLKDDSVALSSELAAARVDHASVKAGLEAESNEHLLLKDNYATLRNELAALQESHAALEGTHTDLQDTCTRLERQYNKASDEVTGITKELERTLDVVRALETGKSDLTTETAKLATDLANMSRQYRETSDSNMTKEKEINELRAQVAETNRELREQTAEVKCHMDAKVVLQDKLTTVQNEFIDLKQEARRDAAQLQLVESEKQKLETGNAKLEGEKQNLETDKAELEKDRQTLRGEKQRLEGEVQRLEGERQRLEESFKTTKLELDANVDKVSNLGSMLHTSQDTANAAQQQYVVLQETAAKDQSKVQQLLRAVDTANTTIQESATRLNDAQTRLREVTADLETQKNTNKDIGMQLKATQDNLVTTKAQLEVTTSELQNANTTISTVKGLNANLQTENEDLANKKESLVIPGKKKKKKYKNRTKN